MSDISAFGLRVALVASRTFPTGLSITQFSDDADPVDSPNVQIKDKAMGINGDLVTWSKANPALLTIAVIPNSDDDRNLAALLQANRVGRGKRSARDVITAIVIWPDGSPVTFTNGALTDGPAASSAASSGRMKSKTYSFAFENVSS